MSEDENRGVHNQLIRNPWQTWKFYFNQKYSNISLFSNLMKASNQYALVEWEEENISEKNLEALRFVWKPNDGIAEVFIASPWLQSQIESRLFVMGRTDAEVRVAECDP